MVTYHYALLKIVTNEQELLMSGFLSRIARNIQHFHPHAGLQCLQKSGDQTSLQGFSRVNVAIMFGSQVLPPSSENACSKRCECGVTADQTIRTAIDTDVLIVRSVKQTARAEAMRPESRYKFCTRTGMRDDRSQGSG
jgi:hypothetical protein